MRAMKDSGIEWIGKIPDCWKTARTKNYYFSTKSIVGSEAETYERLALTLNGVIKRSKEDNNGLQPKQFETYQILKPNELVFKLIDLENVSTSRVGRSPFLGIVSPAYIVLHNRKDEDTRYAEYYFRSLWLNQIFNHIGQDGVRSNLSAGALLSIPFLEVPISEQQRIADFLDEKCADIDTAISEAKASIEDYKLLKQSIITKAVTKGLNLNAEMKDSGIEWIGKIPEEWKMSPIKRVFASHVGGVWGDEPQGDDNDRVCMRIADFDFANGRFKNVDVETFTKRNYTDTQIEEMSLAKGDILIEKSGGGDKTPVGRAVIFDKDFPALFANFMERVRLNDKVVPRFVEYWWQSMYFQDITKVYIRQTTGIQNLHIPSLIQNEPILYPVISEQQRIADFLDEKCSTIDTLISEKAQIISELEAYKKSLIFEYVTGKKEVA